MSSLVLGSGSPRRRDLLKEAGYSFSVRSADIDESLHTSMTPKDAVLWLSKQKSDAISIEEGEVLLTADTVVAIGNQIVGKPKDYEEAYQMLARLSGQTHQVFTGVSLRSHNTFKSFAVCTYVTFYSLSKVEIEAYLETEEAWDKAGGYGIQGKGALFVESIKGDYYSVVGLPISRVVRELRTLGISLE